MKIKIYTSYNENNNTHYYTMAEVVNALPNVGDPVNGDQGVIRSIWPIRLDAEQGSRDVYNYDYYWIETEYNPGDPDAWTEETAVAIEKRDDD